MKSYIYKQPGKQVVMRENFNGLIGRGGRKLESDI